MALGKVPLTYHIGGEEYAEMLSADVCTGSDCDEAYILANECEMSEHRVAMKLIEQGKRDVQSIRFMLTSAGVYIDEILMRFPTLDREVVRGWSRGQGSCPESILPEVLSWAQGIAKTGYNPDCRCGQCAGHINTHSDV